MRIALITGASSGIGRDMAHYLNSLNYELILVGRNKEKLNKLKKQCRNASVIVSDLSSKEEVYKLYLKTKNKNIDLLINNAGFGLFGFFNDTDLEVELKMINVNIIATHMLTKLFMQDFIARDKGHILNVSSSAGFMAGPYLSTYYATKNYSLKLTLALYEELKRQKSNVKVSVLCPGPVNTNFNKVAGGKYNIKGLSSEYVAKYAINQVLKNKLIIVPTFKMKLGLFLTRFLPTKLLLKMTYLIQKRKFR